MSAVTFDVLVADVCAWVMANGLWLLACAVCATAGSGAACWWQQRRAGGVRDQRAAVGALTLRLADAEASAAEARLIAALERHNAVAATELAQRAHGRAAELAGDLSEFQARLGRLHDQTVTARMEKQFKGERP